MPASQLSYNDAVPVNKKLLGWLLLFQLVIFGGAVFLPLKISLVMIIGISTLLLIVFLPSPLITTIILSLIITIILTRPTGRSFMFEVEEIFPVIAFLFFLVNFLRGDYNRKGSGKVGFWLGGFLAIVLISAIIGLLKGRGAAFVGDELMMFFYWGIFLLS